MNKQPKEEASDSPKTNPPHEGPSTSTTERALDIPVRVFKQFVIDLTAAGVAAEVVERLRKTLLDDQTFTEAALTAAVLEEPPS